MMTGVTVRRSRSKLRPIALCGLLLALPPAAGWAKNQKPDPDGLPPHDVKDLHYGDVLFYFYQDDYFDSITRLLAAQQLERLPHTEGEAELLLGGLYLSLGEHVEAGKIFEALLAGKVSEAVRNKAWFYLGKVWYQRGYLDESEHALRQVSDKIQPRISAERYMLLAQLKLREGKYDEAIAALQSWHGAPDWTAYAQFNLGVALVRKDRLPEAIYYLDRVGRIESRDEELLSLRDKANLALGFAYLQAKRPADARPILERVRLEGPFSSMALLGVGWADSALGDLSGRWCRGSRCVSATSSTPPCKSPISPCRMRITSWVRPGRPLSTTAPRSIPSTPSSSASTNRSRRSATAICSTGC